MGVLDFAGVFDAPAFAATGRRSVVSVSVGGFLAMTVSPAGWLPTSQGCCRYTVLRARKKSPDWGRFIGKLSNFPNRQAATAQTSGNLAVQGCCITPRTRHDSQWNLPEKRLPAVPAGQFRKNIRAHQPDKAGSGETTFERTNGVEGVTRAERSFNIGGDKPTVGCQPLDRGQTCSKRRHTLAGFEWIARRDHQPDLIETKLAQGPESDLDVSLMRRIKRSTEETDPGGATVTPDRDRIVMRNHDTFMDASGLCRGLHNGRS